MASLVNILANPYNGGMSTDPPHPLTFDGITLLGDRICGDPDGYDRILAWDPNTSQRLVEITLHRDTRHLGLRLLDDRKWSFRAIEDMRQLGVTALV